MNKETKLEDSQALSDIAVGVFAPLVCLIFDPFVFTQFLSCFQIFAYCFIGLEMIVLIGWLVFGERFFWWGGFIAGIFLSGALFSFALGIILLPLSILGSILIIGSLGFIPFFTSIVFFQNSKRAFYKIYKHKINRIWLISSLLLGMSLAVVIPSSIQWYVNQRIYLDFPTLSFQYNSLIILSCPAYSDKN